jgi:hypothetical protein
MSGTFDFISALRNFGIAELLKLGVMIVIISIAWQRAQDKYDILSARVDALEHSDAERAAEVSKRLYRMDGKLDDIQHDLLTIAKGYRTP